jgi:hypothetical protein
VKLYIRFLNADRTPAMIAALGVMAPIVVGLVAVFATMLAIAEGVLA